MANNEKFSAFLTGFLAGGIIGSVIAMMYTPMTGKKFRRKITTVKDDVIDEINDYYEMSKEKADKIIKDSKKKAESIIEEARKLVSG